MPIVDLDSRLRELGRLRLGIDAGDHPEALEVWRLTSPHEDLLARAATLYGGTVDVWQDGYELTTTVSELPVLIPAQDLAAGQWFELWAGSKISRRCDGINLVELDSNGTPIPAPAAGPCLCDADERDCKPTTVLRVVLPELPDLGVWRLVTRSIYAALELPGAVTLLVRAHGGELAPATIAIESRRGSGRRPFMVPVLRSPLTLTELTELEAVGPSLGTGRLESSASASLEGSRHAIPTAPTPSAAPALEVAGASANTDEDAPHGDEQNPGPIGPNDSKRGEWEDLGRLLRANPPANLPKHTETILEVLTELEELMVAVNLWSPTTAGVSPLDSSASKYELEDWRAGSTMTAALHTFALRSLMAAGNAFLDSRAGAQINRELEEVTE